MQSFLDVLSQIRGGAALTDAAKDLQELVQAVRDTGKSGKLTFSITVEPDKADETVVTLQPDVTLKLPKKARAKGIFYMDRHGTLTREDPRQLELLAEKEAERQAEREAQEAAGIKHLERIGRG
ncbi:hypothetical protein IVB34_12685 [Bradyrhizobium sp. 2]|uniref:hypothetical protein n=1 Tax=Bradyrhizobium sp. 2 TaxID=190045 RepID=UPI001FFB3CDD|nr:hypothetical protein [Bradyrhizobium sp. 2]MCK1459143.1 hypothetical protein [Bradyrhizobium sp. 2]MCK1459211.1 hypothetical protein [Bradyrhizobium sp. 2]